MRVIVVAVIVIAMGVVIMIMIAMIVVSVVMIVVSVSGDRSTASHLLRRGMWMAVIVMGVIVTVLCVRMIVWRWVAFTHSGRS